MSEVTPLYLATLHVQRGHRRDKPTPADVKEAERVIAANNGLELFLYAQGKVMCQDCKCCEMVPSDEPCWHCGDEGYTDLYDEDPLWYDEDDIEICPYCADGPVMVCIGGCEEGKHAKRTPDSLAARSDDPRKHQDEYP